MLFLRSNKRVPKFLLCADFFLFPGDNKKSVLFPGAHRVPHYGYPVILWIHDPVHLDEKVKVLIRIAF